MRTPRLLVVAVAIPLVISVGGVGLLRATPVVASTSTLAVVGNHLVDNGNTVVLRGVNRSGSEYACYQGFGFFDGPSDDTSIAAIAAWGSNAVRVPLNEDCWLGINGVPAAYSGANYVAAIAGFVTRLRAHGLYVILDNQFAGPGTTLSNSILPMPDADHAPTLWTQVATSFASDKGVIFDLYNEAHGVTWSCWANGCLVNGYQAAGMTTLTAAVRATGATNVILIGGLSYNYDISGWLANRPNDGQLIAGIHNYGYPGWDTPTIWDSIYAPTALQVPVTFGEMGFDGYIEKIMPWADAHGIGYLAWTWDTWGNNEALISDYNGTPTTYGLGFKNYLAGLAPSPTVSSVAPNNGLATGATPVTITGTNLTGATTVHFGATAASVFAVVSATTITATSPAGSGSVDVTVTTTGGTSAITAGDKFTYGTPPLAPTGLRAVAGDGEATLTWTPPGAGTSITGYRVVASPGGATTTVSAVVPAATITGLTNGTAYTFTVAATNAIATGPASAVSAAVTPTAVAQGPSVAVLPAMSDGAYGGYLTAAYLENVSASAAHIRVQYFDVTGHGVGNGNSVAGLPAGATWTLRTDNGDSLAATQAGSAVVYSDQPLAVFVNEFAPGNSSDATSYTAIGVPAGTGNTLFAPAIANNAYGGYTTGIGLVSLATVPTNIAVTYRDSSGTVVQTQTLPNIAAGAYQGLYSGAANLPSGFTGTATITSSAGNLAAVVNETGPGGQFSSYDAVPAGSTKCYAPVALRNAFGGYNTGMGIQNTTATAGTVTITYYDSTGAATVKTFPIVANGYVGVYQGTDIPVDGAYTAKLTSTVAIAAIVNEVAASSNPSVQQSTAYNTFAAGSSSLHLPLVESAGADGWSTGEGIMNTGSAATTVTVTYYDPVTGVQVGTPQSLSLQPNAFWGLYQPAGGLPNGTRASAVVTTASGGQVAVICNESNASSFMSYIGQ